ncbi:Myc-type, basic helix-loop-helix domain-containing protein [Halteromyces radiatus]|uniref:Myc-type, basic helix-loop-helix domain-containing protein n=1 Tax=Halteromyces radiatus TaxID=101107 RepID=UPI002220C8FC|nr:Myc-type, basic helix-loop-helix domain-containing protein [Halteromyces radiatus]KAI8077714.1 Myc-type, basic helix-loop-helix domain-containing protein [Halteromyces radiatus]
MDYESLDPNSRILQPPTNPSFRSHTNPCHYASPSPVNSRRGSMIDSPHRPSTHTSPPSSPSHTLRPSPLEHRPDLISSPPLHSPWRRDSLPSISQLTSELEHQFTYPNHTIARTRHTSSPASLRLSSQAPYSRSPELRVSHKLAERKRRKEMKDLFDDLRELLPVDKGLKTSKWEILSKAVGYISHLHEREESFAKEAEELRRELMILKQQ